jgi:hypothetical protein
MVDPSDRQDRVYFWLDSQTVDALELTLEHLRRALTRPMSWKWVIIGIHTALHGSFGLVLRRSDGAQLHIRSRRPRFTSGGSVSGLTEFQRSTLSTLVSTCFSTSSPRCRSPSG